jgi:Cd2+/Zn2+-exporting ATPase
LERVRQLRPDINLLMVIACAGAAVIGDWPESRHGGFLFGVAEWLESWSDRSGAPRRDRDALLENRAQRRRRVNRTGCFTEVAVEEVQIGETIAVKSA